MGILGGIKNIFQKAPEAPEKPEISSSLFELGEDTLGRRIMLVDPSPFIRGLLRTTLEKYGYAVAAETNSGAECVRLYRACRPNAVFMRVSLGQESGLDRLAELKREEPSAQVVMCENNDTASRELAQTCFQLGAADFILLPFKANHLLHLTYALCPAHPKEAEAALAALEQAKAQERAAREAAETAAREAGKLIMLIEPSPSCKFIPEAREVLAHNEYMVIESPFSADGYLDVYRKKRPNLVIMSTTVFCGDSLEVIDTLKKEDPSVQILICSYMGQPAMVQAFIRRGAKGFLVMPFPIGTFMEQIKRLCQPPVQTETPSPMCEAPAGESPLSPDELLAKIQEAANRKTGPAARVLVIQKAEFMQSIIRNTLEERSFEVVGTASEGWRCLELYRETKPDLVIMDTVLADDVDGVKIFQLLQKEDPSVKVLMSGAPEERIRSGAAYFLNKPFKPENLMEKVWDTLRRQGGL